MSSCSDYSFMRSGKSGSNESAGLSINEDEIRQLLALFISNSLINAARYTKLCKRNGVTKTDMILGIKYEIREFFERETLYEDFEEIKRDFENLKDEAPIKFKVEYVDTRTGIINESEVFESEDDAEDYICKLEEEEYYVDFGIIEITESDMMMYELVTNEEEINEFTKITIDQIREAEQEDRQFISRIHIYDSEWDNWEPPTPILSILKNAANKMMEQ